MDDDENNLTGVDNGENGEDESLYSDDDEEVDVAAVIRDFGGHDMMQGIQKTLADQLIRQKDRITLEMRELQNELSMSSKKKEQIGVELYGNQQQLARMQMALENLHSQFHSLAEARIEEEGVLEQCKQRHASMKETYAEKQKALLKAQAELDTLTGTAMQVEKYNEEMKAEIAITRRATYKAESSVKDLEKAKQGQDLYIDKLNQNVKMLREEAETYRAQLAAQAAQTDEAKEILKETAGEMDLINFEKKQLMVQWKAALVNLTKRDEAVAAAKASVDKAKDEIRDLQADLLGTKREILAAQNGNEASEALRDRLSKELGGLEEQISKILADRDLVAERFQMLQRSMMSTAEEEKNADNIKIELNKKLETIQQNIAVVSRERQKLEMAILEKGSEKVTVAKAVKNYAKDMQKLKTRIHDKEMETAAVENELSRVRIDSLNTDAHNIQLKEMLNKAVGELADKDKLIEKYQLEIRQRNDEIEKKMLKVDSLNRKYEKLLEAHRAAGGGDGPLLGPLEATIKALKKEVQDLSEESLGLQRDWLKDQTALVDSTAETEELLTSNQELQARLSILSEKRLRMSKQAVTLESEIKRLESAGNGMQTDMGRLNELIGKHVTMHQELSQANSAMETEFVAQLKELEAESMATEQKIADVVMRKDEVLDEIMEAERQMLLWEKKVQLEKETQAALDPQVGLSEVHAMEKEIHRMTLRASTLKGEKERLIKEIERGVHKRETLSLRYKAAPKPSKAASGGKKKEKAEMTKASLTKKLTALKKTVRTSANSVSEYDNAIAERKENLEVMTAQLEELTAKYGAAEETANELQNEINAQLYEKQRTAELATKRQGMVKRYQALENGLRAEVTESDMALVEGRLTETQGQLEAVRNIVTHLSENFQHLDEVLGRVMQLAADE